MTKFFFPRSPAPLHPHPRLQITRSFSEAMPQTSCNGCGKRFSSPKYRRSHLSQAKDPRCQAERQKILSRCLPDYIPTVSPSRSGSPPSSPPIRSSSDPILDPPEHPGTPDRQSREIEGEDILDLEGEDTLDLDGTSTGDENEDLDTESEAESDENENAGDDEHGRFLSAEEVANLQNKTWGDIYVDVYPGPHAGAVHSQGIPTTKEFENVLGGPSPNLFAPFNNQTDWELAKWAKLRGPGSTAFTELMGVTGVRLVSLLCICFTTDTKIVA